MFRSNSHRIAAWCAAAVLVLGAAVLTGPALADDETGATTTTSTETATPATETADTGTTAATGTPPPTTTQSTSASTSTSISPSSEPPPTSSPADGVLHMRAIDVVNRIELADVPVRVFRPEPAETRLPAAMLLPAGHYRVELLAIPGGYRLASSWAVDGVVPAGGNGEVVFEFRPVAWPHERVPIKSIPSGRTR